MDKNKIVKEIYKTNQTLKGIGNCSEYERIEKLVKQTINAVCDEILDKKDKMPFDDCEKCYIDNTCYCIECIASNIKQQAKDNEDSGN